MQTPWMSVLAAALSLALAGCVTEAASTLSPQSNDPAAEEDAATGASALATQGATSAATGPVPLYLGGDLTLTAAPLASEASVTIGDPVNSPEAHGYPTWKGTLPSAVNLSAEGVPIVIYVSANTASLAARQIPPFSLMDIAHFYADVSVGNLAFGASLVGPDVMMAGEVYEVKGTLVGESGGLVPAGAEVALDLEPIYTHVVGAAEFRFVMGPEHPAHVLLGAP